MFGRLSDRLVDARGRRRGCARRATPSRTSGPSRRPRPGRAPPRTPRDVEHAVGLHAQDARRRPPRRGSRRTAPSCSGTGSSRGRASRRPVRCCCTYATGVGIASEEQRAAPRRAGRAPARPAWRRRGCDTRTPSSTSAGYARTTLPPAWALERVGQLVEVPRGEPRPLDRVRDAAADGRGDGGRGLRRESGLAARPRSLARSRATRPPSSTTRNVHREVRGNALEVEVRGVDGRVREPPDGRRDGRREAGGPAPCRRRAGQPGGDLAPPSRRPARRSCGSPSAAT